MDRIFEEEKLNLKNTIDSIDKKCRSLSKTVKEITTDISKLSSADYQERHRLIGRRNDLNKNIDELNEWKKILI